MIRLLDAVRDAAIIALLLSAVACGDKVDAAPAGSTSPAASASPASRATSVSPTSRATAAASAAPAAPAGPSPCADPKATHVAEAGFCIMVPDGYKAAPYEQKEGGRGRAKFADAGGANFLAIEVEEQAPSYYDLMKKTVLGGFPAKDKTVLEQGDIAGGKGFFVLYEWTGSHWMIAYAHSATKMFKCTSNDTKQFRKPEQLAACKSLAPTG